MANKIKHAPDVRAPQLNQQVIAVGTTGGRKPLRVAATNSSSSFTPAQKRMMDDMGLMQAPARTADG
jgi:hypothetical protein